MKRALVIALTLAILFLGLVAPAAADAPTDNPFEMVFEDVDPCTGEDLIVTMTGTWREHFHNGRFVAYMERTITTSPIEYTGRGTTILNHNGEVRVFAINDMLVSESGDRIRAHYVLVFDISGDSVLVEHGGINKCLTR